MYCLSFSAEEYIRRQRPAMDIVVHSMHIIDLICLGRKSACVAQTSKSAVPPISKSARHAKSSPKRAWKPAAQQTWKSALRLKAATKADLRP
jgi:hypothetical protein